MKGFFFYGEHRDTGLGSRCCRGNEQGKVSGAFMMKFLKGFKSEHQGRPPYYNYCNYSGQVVQVVMGCGINDAI